MQLIKENEEVVVEKEEDPILLFKELPSFNEEEEDKIVVTSLEKHIMAFEPLQSSEDLLQTEQEDHLLQYSPP